MSILTGSIEKTCASCQNVIPEDVLKCECETRTFPTIPGYKIVSCLGEGGMGLVYLAEELDLGRKVAIKIISPRVSEATAAMGRFEREARVMATVEHRHIVRVYTFSHFHGGSFLVLEYIEGESLANYIKRSKRLPVPEAIRILRQIIEGLAATWNKKIVHRDIKPSNILLDKNLDAHVTDFGLAKPIERHSDDPISFNDMLVGTPYYIAPEQALGQPADFRADIYSLGIMLYEMLTGEKPFDGKTPFEILNRQLTCQLPPIREKRSDIPDRVVQLLEWMTQKKPNQRPKSYSELLKALSSLPENKSMNISQMQTASLWRPLHPVWQKWRFLFTLLLIAMLTTLVFVSLKEKSHKLGFPEKAEMIPAIAITPFYGPDEESSKEGKIMAALIEKTIHERLGDATHIIGVDQTQQPVRSHDAARALGNKLGTTLVIWGDVFVLRNEIEIDPHLTLIQNKRRGSGVRLLQSSSNMNPFVSLLDRPNVVVFRSEAPNQIELRKTSADSIGDMVSLLIAIHALYGENDAKKALTLFEDSPVTPEKLYYRASALIQLGKQQEAINTLRDCLTLNPEYAPAHALLGDLKLTSDAFTEAVSEYQAAAKNGLPFSTARAFFYDGKLYKKETFRNKTISAEKELETSWIVAIDPESGKVVERYHLPGIPQVFTIRNGAVEILYDTGFGQQSRTLFKNGKLDLPAFGEEDLLLRIQSMQSGWTLPTNFLSDWQNGETLGNTNFEASQIIDENLPRTLPELERALKEAIDRDPTQPWHSFFLGQTLWRQGHKEQAENTWKQLTAKRYFYVCYYEFSWMASLFESFGQREWADFAYQQALELRKNLPVPVSFSTPLERMINANFLRSAAFATKNSGDLSRGYLWLNRARELTGICPEMDQLTAALWGNYFRKQRNIKRANAEDQLLSRSQNNPLNILRAATLLDYSFYFCLAASAAFLLVFLFLLLKALTFSFAYRKNAAPPISNKRKFRGIVYGLLIVLGSIAVKQMIDIYSLEAILAGSCVAGLVIAVMHSKRITVNSMIGFISGPQRKLFVLAFFMLIASVAITVHENSVVQSLSKRPVIPSDIRETPALLEYMEERMTISDNANIRFITAVLNQKTGNLDRARELYRSIETHAGAKQNLTALQNGSQFFIKEPTPSEIQKAFSDTSWWSIALNVWNPGEGANIFLVGTDSSVEADPGSPSSLLFQLMILTGIGLMLSFLLIRPVADATYISTKTKSRFPGKCVASLIPGSFDILREHPVHGYIALLFFLFAAGGLFAQRMIPDQFPVPGVATFLQASNYLNLNSLPMPVQQIEAETLVRRLFWSLFWSYPYARIFWGFLVFAGCTALLLHISRLKAIWRNT